MNCAVEKSHPYNPRPNKNKKPIPAGENFLRFLFSKFLASALFAVEINAYGIAIGFSIRIIQRINLFRPPTK